MTKLETEIDGYEVQLEVYVEGREPRSDCFVGRNSSRRQWAWSSSLACLMDTGELAHYHDHDPHAVSQHTIERIETWALENGY